MSEICKCGHINGRTWCRENVEGNDGVCPCKMFEPAAEPAAPKDEPCSCGVRISEAGYVFNYHSPDCPNRPKTQLWEPATQPAPAVPPDFELVPIDTLRSAHAELFNYARNLEAEIANLRQQLAEAERNQQKFGLRIPVREWNRRIDEAERKGWNEAIVAVAKDLLGECGDYCSNWCWHTKAAEAIRARAKPVSDKEQPE